MERYSPALWCLSGFHVLAPRHGESGHRSSDELEQHACLGVLVMALGKLLTPQGIVLRCKAS